MRLERHNLYQMFETFNTKYTEEKTPFKLEFKSLYELQSILSPFRLREIVISFFNFKLCFEKIDPQQKKNFLQKYDFIYCSIFDRVFSLGNIF